jgi:hypothetical protein
LAEVVLSLLLPPPFLKMDKVELSLRFHQEQWGGLDGVDSERLVRSSCWYAHPRSGGAASLPPPRLCAVRGSARRPDGLFERLDALLTAPSMETPAPLSLVPTCQRGWGSLYDALNAGSMDGEPLERLRGSSPRATETTWYAGDASVWPRGDAQTRPARGSYAHPSRHAHGPPSVAGWNSSWLGHLPRRCSSWTAPLRVRRLTPGETGTAAATEPLRWWLGQAPPGAPDAPLPIGSFEAGSDAVPLSLALADTPVSRVVRLRAGRCLSADPTAPPATGRPRRPGAQVVGADPAAGPEPSDPWAAADLRSGHGCLCAWSGRHPVPQQQATRGTRGPRPLGRGTLRIRLAVARRPRPTKPPAPLWFWWGASPCPPALAELWHAYIARFAIEHPFRGFKQTLKWTTPTRRAPEAADRWTGLLLLAYVQLRLAREPVAALR